MGMAFVQYLCEGESEGECVCVWGVRVRERERASVKEGLVVYLILGL